MVPGIKPMHAGHTLCHSPVPRERFLPAEWHPVQCWHGVLWWPFAVVLEKHRAHVQRNSPLPSSSSPLCHPEQCFFLLRSILKKENVWVNDKVIQKKVSSKNLSCILVMWKQLFSFIFHMLVFLYYSTKIYLSSERKKVLYFCCFTHP